MDRVAVLGEQRSTVDLVATAFEYQGVEVSRIGRQSDVVATLANKPYLLIIFCLERMESIELKGVSRLVAASPDTPIVPAVFTLRLDIALAAIRLGAFDVLVLPSTAEVVRNLLVRTRLYRQKTVLRHLGIFSQFSSWFAHEVRNPLAGILNSAQLLHEESASSALVRRRLGIIIEEGHRLEQFLRRMTEFGRTHRGRPLSTSLNAVVEQVLARAEPQLQRQRIQLRRDLDPRMPEVLIDITQMETAVSRLIANAATAMPGGGVMTVFTRHRPDEQAIDLEVTDTDCETGLERERQLSGLRDSSGLKEAGLGLVAALQTFVDHGGDMLLRILPGQGCSIVARLPLNGRSGRP
ncbi:MAG: hypothetical protein F9K13_09745 [Candidatus Methylomirabilis oxygeniifera]|uniref:histidine kinase n=1 Tax=Methylomirabilis oxygeniifera TaxID=671143 RepID=D5MGE4_METO1|nr:MAG: hypothetical protein F9K13_09745 [Candidatus Methylomirabilis oxyfera]CBE68825.1 putative Histidine kinase [Candidatus Methylomirabilis oxyfera]